MGTARNLFMARMAKRGLRGAGGLMSRGVRGGASRVTNALEMQRSRNRQAERGMQRVGAEEYENVNYRTIDRKGDIKECI